MRIVIPVLLLLYSCSTTADNKIIREGKQLAELHCSSCHLLPEPGLLDKKTWAYQVLPKMGGLLGFQYLDGTTYVEKSSTDSGLTLDQWNKIVSYYIRLTADSLRGSITPKIDTNFQLFSAEIPGFRIDPPLTSYVGIFNNEVIFGDGVTKKIYRLNDTVLQDSLVTDAGICQVFKRNGRLYGLAMGVMYPSDAFSGKLVVYDNKKPITLLDSLQRPVYVAFADMNTDGLEDAVICEFGNNTGQLSLFAKKMDGSFSRKILKPLPGAVKAVVKDFNEDGRPDVMAMMAQADEGLFIFYNQGENKFREERLLTFSPAYGSNYFELADLNDDGYDDIVATNGDNGDYPAILKPYHGIRVYINDGSNHFEEKLFLPVNGACKVLARDFDLDGDMDLASIAYFPDYTHRPLEAFIFWENDGNMNFKPRSLPVATTGRWLVMDASDIDGDGDQDIVLGNAKSGMGVIPADLKDRWKEGSPSIVLLINNKNKIKRL